MRGLGLGTATPSRCCDHLGGGAKNLACMPPLLGGCGILGLKLTWWAGREPGCVSQGILGLLMEFTDHGGVGRLAAGASGAGRPEACPRCRVQGRAELYLRQGRLARLGPEFGFGLWIA